MFNVLYMIEERLQKYNIHMYALSPYLVGILLRKLISSISHSLMIAWTFSERYRCLSFKSEMEAMNFRSSISEKWTV